MAVGRSCEIYGSQWAILVAESADQRKEVVRTCQKVYVGLWRWPSAKRPFLYMSGEWLLPRRCEGVGDSNSDHRGPEIRELVLSRRRTALKYLRVFTRPEGFP